MTFDIEAQLSAATRTVSSAERAGQPARTVTVARGYAVGVEDLWDALTNPERLAHWFLPVSGDLRRDGRYQFEGNAGGVITACDAPSRLALTWEYGDDTSWVEVLLAEDGVRRATVSLAQCAPLSKQWEEFGPGATGVGWELAFFGLALHVETPAAPKLDEESFAASPEGKAFITRSSQRWGEAAVVAGADPVAARAAARRTAAFYTGSPEEGV